MNKVISEQLKSSRNQIKHLLAKTSNLLFILKSVEHDLAKELFHEVTLLTHMANQNKYIIDHYFKKTDTQWVMVKTEKLNSQLSQALKEIADRHNL